jgi:hypothetical protein
MRMRTHTITWPMNSTNLDVMPMLWLSLILLQIGGRIEQQKPTARLRGEDWWQFSG